jgi:hypothetical protein
MENKKYSLALKIGALALWAAYYIFLGLVSGGTLAIIVYELFIARL